MEDDDEEIVEVRAELSLDLYELMSQTARKRGMASDDFLSVLVVCDMQGTPAAVAEALMDGRVSSTVPGGVDHRLELWFCEAPKINSISPRMLSFGFSD
jgi:hypothetical protein